MTTDAVQKSYLSSTALSVLYNLNRFIYTASELYLDANYLNARFYYLICSQFMERMNFRKKMTILIIQTGNFYSVLFSQNFRACATATPGNLQSTLTEGDRCHLPVDPCQSKRLTSLGNARWQTVVLLFSVMLTSEYHVESVVY